MSIEIVILLTLVSGFTFVVKAATIGIVAYAVARKLVDYVG